MIKLINFFLLDENQHGNADDDVDSICHLNELKSPELTNLLLGNEFDSEITDLIQSNNSHNRIFKCSETMNDFLFSTVLFGKIIFWPLNILRLILMID